MPFQLFPAFRHGSHGFKTFKKILSPWNPRATALKKLEEESDAALTPSHVNSGAIRLRKRTGEVIRESSQKSPVAYNGGRRRIVADIERDSDARAWPRNIPRYFVEAASSCRLAQEPREFRLLADRLHRFFDAVAQLLQSNLLPYRVDIEEQHQANEAAHCEINVQLG